MLWDTKRACLKKINITVSIKHSTDGWDVMEIHVEGQSPTLSKKFCRDLLMILSADLWSGCISFSSGPAF